MYQGWIVGINKLTSQSRSVQIKLPIFYIFGFIALMFSPLSNSWGQPLNSDPRPIQIVPEKKDTSNRTLPVTEGGSIPTHLPNIKYTLPPKIKYIKYSPAEIPGGDSVPTKSIDDLSPAKRKQFDQAYTNWKFILKMGRGFPLRILEENQLLGTAVNKLNGELSTGESQIKQEIGKLPSGWNTILQPKNSPERQRWVIAFHRANLSKVYQELAEDELFRPLLSWWSKLVFTDENLKSFVF